MVPTSFHHRDYPSRPLPLNTLELTNESLSCKVWAITKRGLFLAGPWVGESTNKPFKEFSVCTVLQFSWAEVPLIFKSDVLEALIPLSASWHLSSGG